MDILFFLNNLITAVEEIEKQTTEQLMICNQYVTFEPHKRTVNSAHISCSDDKFPKERNRNLQIIRSYLSVIYEYLISCVQLNADASALRQRTVKNA